MEIKTIGQTDDFLNILLSSLDLIFLAIQWICDLPESKGMIIEIDPDVSWDLLSSNPEAFLAHLFPF